MINNTIVPKHSADEKFKDFTHYWLDEIAPTKLGASTAATYRSMCGNIDKELGNISLKRLDSSRILDFCTSLMGSGINGGEKRANSKSDLAGIISAKNLSFTALSKKAGVAVITVSTAVHGKNVTYESASAIAKALNMPFNTLFQIQEASNHSFKTAENYLHMISSVLQSAVDMGFLHFNVAKCVKLQQKAETKAPEKTSPALTQKDLSDILTLLENEGIKWKTCVHLILHTMITRSELMGLEWKDIDFTDKTLYIRRGSQTVPGLTIIEIGESNFTHKRKIKLSDSAITLLEEYKAWQETDIKQKGERWNSVITIAFEDGSTEERENDRLFTQKYGEPMNPDSLTDWFSKFSKKNKIMHLNLNMLRNKEIQVLMSEGMISYGQTIQTKMRLNNGEKF